MDLKQLEYIVKIEEEGSITHAAEKLFITQSALNQQLLKLEKELGVPLFTRSRSSCVPTESGLIYLESARQILAIKRDTYNRIYDLAEQKKGIISVGFTPIRGTILFADVYPRFHREYPEIEIRPQELSVVKQEERLADGRLDLGFVTLQDKLKKPSLSYINLGTEEVFLALPANHPLARDAEHTMPFIEFDLGLLKDEPFVVMQRGSTKRALVDPLFVEAGFKPNILFETTGTDTLLSMVRSEICCGFIPSFYISPAEDKIAYFSLPQHPSWDFCACMNKHAYKSRAIRTLIRLVTETSNRFSGMAAG